MGYNGMGYQRWIATMKPKKFLQKRSKPDGGGIKNDTGSEIRDYFHIQQNNLENLLQKKYPLSYKAEIEKRFQSENKRNRFITIGGIIISVAIIAAFFFYLSAKTGLF